MIKQNLIFFDDASWENLLPLTYTKPASELRVGITTIHEKWAQYALNISWITQEYLSEKYPLELSDDNIFVRSNILPTEELLSELLNLKEGQGITKDDVIIAFRNPEYTPESLRDNIVLDFKVLAIEHTWDIFEKNEEVLQLDFKELTNGRKSQELSSTNNVLNPENIFLEEGAKVEFATIDASEGYVYVGKDATIMTGALIQGSLAVCEHAAIKMGAKIYGATTVGPWSKVGGEVQNSILMGYSNKGHDGYLGNAVLGEWCNIGADTNNSNLKNNYAKVKMWDYSTGRFANTGLQFCGLVMGDHSKCGINTMFNTGTVVGVNANIFGSGFPRNFVPSFSWGGAGGFSLYPIQKALETAKIVLARRGLELSDVDKKIMEEVFILSEKYRK